MSNTETNFELIANDGYAVEAHRWQGAERVQFRVADVALPDPGLASIR